MWNLSLLKDMPLSGCEWVKSTQQTLGLMAWRHREWSNKECSVFNFDVLLSVWRTGSALVSINEVNLHWARLVLGWVTVSEFDYVTSPQAFYPVQDGNMCRPYQPKGGDSLRLGSKGRYDFAGKTACCHIWAHWKMQLAVKWRFTNVHVYFYLLY